MTNVGPGADHGLTIGSLVTPSGRSRKLREGRLGGAWQLAPDRRAADIRNSHFSFRPPLYQIEVREKKASVRLSFAPNGREVTPVATLPQDYRYEILAQASEAQGQVWVKGMEAPRAVAGRATLIHAWTQGAEWDAILRRIEFYSTQAGPRLHLVEFTTPKGERKGWLGLTDSQGGTAFSDTDFQIRMSGAKTLAGETRYWVPESLRVESPNAKGEIVLKRIVAEHDPLGDIPQPFRFIVSLSMRPHRVWADAEFEVTLRPGPTAHSLHHQGAGVAVVTFLNPVSLP